MNEADERSRFASAILGFLSALGGGSGDTKRDCSALASFYKGIYATLLDSLSERDVRVLRLMLPEDPSAGHNPPKPEYPEYPEYPDYPSVSSPSPPMLSPNAMNRLSIELYQMQSSQYQNEKQQYDRQHREYERARRAYDRRVEAIERNYETATEEAAIAVSNAYKAYLTAMASWLAPEMDIEEKGQAMASNPTNE